MLGGPLVKELFRGNQFCPEEVIYGEEFLILKKKDVVSVYFSGTLRFYREIRFEERIWRIWKDSNDSFRAMGSNGLYVFDPESGKRTLEREFPKKWLWGKRISDSKYLMVDSDHSLELCNGSLKSQPLSKRRVKSNPLGSYVLDGNSELVVFVEEAESTNERINFISSEEGKPPWQWFNSNKVTVLIVHPTDPCAVVGDVSGKVTFWRPSSQGSFIYSVFHWHSTPVRSLCFSDDFIFSGGEEEVLIKWSTKERYPVATIPRLGGALAHIFVNDTNVILSLSSNSLLCLESSSLRKKFYLAGPNFESIAMNVQWFSPFNSVVLSYSSKALQFIDPVSRKETMRLEVIQENKITGEPNIDQSREFVFNFSTDNNWLATAYRYEDSIKVSVWKFSVEDSNSFSLKTTWTEYKCLSPILIKFVNFSNDLVLIGSDNKVKFWSLDDERETHYWLKSLSYKNLVPSNVTTSEDGSVIAVSFDRFITLWDNNDSIFSLITSLSSSSSLLPITSVEFGKNRNSGLLFSSTNECILVWDILRMKLLKKITATDPRLIPVPDKKIVAYMDKNGLYMLDKDSSEKVFEYDVESVCFCTTPSGGMIGYYLRSNKVLGHIKWSKTLDSDEANSDVDPSSISKGTSFLPAFNVAKKKSNHFMKDPSLYFETVQFPLSSFASDFVDKGVIMYKDTFFYD